MVFPKVFSGKEKWLNHEKPTKGGPVSIVVALAGIHILFTVYERNIRSGKQMCKNRKAREFPPLWQTLGPRLLYLHKQQNMKRVVQRNGCNVGT